jgi:hypothetical protein
LKLTAGSRWMSPVCTTEVVVVKTPAAEVTLECGGSAMCPGGTPRAANVAPAPGFSGGSLLGKRYASQTAGLEVLCTKSGTGSLSLDGQPLALRESKPLPSSD